MTEINDKIIKWLRDNKIDTLDPDKQYLKIIEEVGELARGILKNDLEAIKDAIGDIYVALMGYSLQRNIDFNVVKGVTHYPNVRVLKVLLWSLLQDEISDIDITVITGILDVLANEHNLTLKECVSHAYNEIKDRDIKIKNGVAVKDD